MTATPISLLVETSFKESLICFSMRLEVLVPDSDKMVISN